MKKKKNKKIIPKDPTSKGVVNLMFEFGILAKTPRSGFHFLGTGEQSVAEHVSRAVFISYLLAMMDGTVDVLTVLKMSLLHDISETRISDLNYVHQKYVDRKEHDAIKHISDSIPFGKDIFDTIHEYEARESKESILVKDADNLEWILSLKEEADQGNTRAWEWCVKASARLVTKQAKMIVKEILSVDSTDWFQNKKVVMSYKDKLKKQHNPHV